MFGEYLKKVRRKRNITQLEMSTKMGLRSSQYVSNIERGLATLPVFRIDEVATILKVEPEEILEQLKNEKIESLESKYITPNTTQSETMCNRLYEHIKTKTLSVYEKENIRNKLKKIERYL